MSSCRQCDELPGGITDAVGGTDTNGLRKSDVPVSLGFEGPMIAVFANIPLLASGNPAIEVFILALCVFPAFLLASQGSRWLVPYVMATWAFGPEVRRINDWMAGQYQSVTLLSLIPMVASLAFLMPMMQSRTGLNLKLRRAVWMIAGTVLYATVLGVVLNGFAAVFQACSLLLPLLIVPYAASRPYVAAERDLWLRSFSTIAVLVAAYGWYQFVQVPAWDLFWYVQSGMNGSAGLMRSGQFRICSTLNSQGALGPFLAAALAVGLCNRRWRGPLGLVGSAVIALSLLINMVRLGWVMCAVTILVYIALSRGASRWFIVVSVTAVVATCIWLLPMLPGFELVSARMDSLGDLGNDGSVQGRLEISAGAFETIAYNPIGKGLGATGAGGALTSASGGNGGFDNGYVDLGIILGIPMSVLLLVGMLLLGKEAVAGLGAGSLSAQHSRLAIAMLVAYFAGLMCFNILGGVCGALLWLALGSAMGLELPEASKAYPNKITRSVARFAPLAGRDARMRSRVSCPPVLLAPQSSEGAGKQGSAE